MRPIPLKMRQIIDGDLFFKRCLICGRLPEINHNFEYADRQINEIWALTPLCERDHRKSNICYHLNNTTREMVDLCALMRATKADFAKYPRRKWNDELNYLQRHYPEKYFINWFYNPYEQLRKESQKNEI
jgi:hypothetical protein